MTSTCDRCGHENPAAANFCSSCGQQLRTFVDEATDTYVLEPEDVPAGEDRAVFSSDIGLLVVQEGPKAGSRIALDSVCTSAGRHPDSDIFLDDVTVSRRHAEVLNESGAYTVRDVGSLNGTYLNRRRIDAALLEDGDVVQIGRFKLVFYHGTQGDG